MRQSTTLVVNTLALVANTLFATAAALVVTRLLLETLGGIDFGLFTVVGATAGFSMILANALADSAGRHLAHAVGRDDANSFRTTFNAALVLYSALAALLVALGLAIGPVIAQLLDVPDDRVAAVRWVFALTCASLATATIVTPYTAAAEAHLVHYLKVWATLAQVTLRLLFALVLFMVPGDRLVMWAALAAIAQAANGATIAILVLRRIPDTRQLPRAPARADIAPLFGFGAWQLLGSLSWRLRMQGVQIALNTLFGPLINASYAVGVQLAGLQSSLSTSIGRVTNPAIIAKHGGEKHDQMYRLIVLTTKYTTVFAAMLAVPIIVEAPAILGLWLGAERTAELPVLVPLVQLISLVILAMSISQGYVFAINATGQIGVFTLATIGIDLGALVLPIVVILASDLGPTTMPIAGILGAAAHAAFRSIYVGRKVGLPPILWLRASVIPASTATAAAALAALGIAAMLEPTLWRLPLTAAGSTAALLSTFWFLGMRTDERARFAELAAAPIRRPHR
ncbi:MAG: hypothetical protein AAGI30_03625 [Planctomycetota bacterium]